MKEHYKVCIENTDSCLSLLRSFWLEEKNLDLKTKWWEKIDSALDERLRLMKLRDAAPTHAP